MSKSMLFWIAALGLAMAQPLPSFGQDKGGPPTAKGDAALDGEWALDKSYSVYTGHAKDSLLVSREHKLAFKGGTLDVAGSVEGKTTTVKYALEVEPAAKPKRFKQTNPSNAADSESGIYWVEKDVLLMRTEKFGKACPEWGFSGIRSSLTDAAGNDADIPSGFLLPKGDRGATILEFRKLKPKK